MSAVAALVALAFVVLVGEEEAAEATAAKDTGDLAPLVRYCTLLLLGSPPAVGVDCAAPVAALALVVLVGEEEAAEATAAKDTGDLAPLVRYCTLLARTEDGSPSCVVDAASGVAPLVAMGLALVWTISPLASSATVRKNSAN